MFIRKRAGSSILNPYLHAQMHQAQEQVHFIAAGPQAARTLLIPEMGRDNTMQLEGLRKIRMDDGILIVGFVSGVRTDQSSLLPGWINSPFHAIS